MSLHNPHRVSAGVPNGGQFAAGQRSETSVALAPDTSPSPAPNLEVAALVAQIRAGIAERDRDLSELADEAELTGRFEYLDERRADYNEQAADDLDRLLDAVGRQSSPAAGAIAYSGQETRIEGSFGEVIVSPRDPESGPGTIVMVDSSAASDGQPLVVMINDEVHHVPVERDSSRVINRNKTVPQLDRDLSAVLGALNSGDTTADTEVHRLSAQIVAHVVQSHDADARYLNLDWGPSGGLEPASIADAFGDSSGPIQDDLAADLMWYTTKMRANGSSIEPAPARSGAPFRLDLDRALDICSDF